MKTKPLDDRFDNLIRARDLRLAWILMGVFCIAMLVASRMSYWIVGFPSTTLTHHLARVVIGMQVALACLLAVWTTLGEGSLIRRVLFLVCATLAILAAWLLGVTASFYPESVRLSSRDEVLFLGLLPTVFFALCLPLIISRCWVGFALADPQQDSPVKAPTTTASLMTLTAIVGCCFGGIRLFAMAGQGDDIIVPILLMCGFSFMVGLLAVLPAVRLLCSSRRSYTIWSLVITTIGCALISGLIIAISQANGAWISTEHVWAIIECTFAAILTFVIGIGIIRLFGYRLTKEAKR